MVRKIFVLYCPYNGCWGFNSLFCYSLPSQAMQHNITAFIAFMTANSWIDWCFATVDFDEAASM